MKPVLSMYANCSLGGMTSVYRARCMDESDRLHHLLFASDMGGLGAYTDIRNADVRIVPSSRLPSLVSYLSRVNEYEEVRITSMPNLPHAIRARVNAPVIYEVHSPIESIVRSEMERLDMNAVEEIRTPSEWASEMVRSFLPQRHRKRVITVSNLVDGEVFNLHGPRASLRSDSSQIPLVWIGRLENTHKNYIDFLRLLSVLEDRFYGVMILSLENDPAKFSKAFGEAALYGVQNRVDMYVNVSQNLMGSIHRAASACQGYFVSTALSESFGYGVVEAAACGLPVVGYDVGPLSEHAGDITLVPTGDVFALRNKISGQTL